MQHECIASDLFLLAQRVLRALRDMDVEAKPVDIDYPTGLWWYPGHLDRDKTPRLKNNTEVCWSTRLAEILGEASMSARAEQYYPDGSKARCDVVVDRPQSKPVWIEMKGSWRGFMDPPKPNTAYRKHLLAAADDLGKLQSLTSKEASAVMMVLVGFDQPELPIEEADLAPISSQTADSSWLELRAQWHVVQRMKFRVRCWVWAREVAERGE